MRGGAFAALAIATIAACKGSTSTPSAAATPSSACGDLYDALDAYAPCGGPLPPASHNRDRFVQFCALHVGAPGAGTAPDAVARCASAIRDAAPSCRDPRDACVKPVGTVATDAPCGTDLQCASGFCRAGFGAQTAPSLLDVIAVAPTACGVCADEAKLGDPCGTPNSSRCPAGAICAPAPGRPGGTCTAETRSDVGGPCGGNAVCKPNLVCDAQKGQCAPVPDLGQPCAGFCASHLVCTNGVCAVGHKAGEACAPQGPDCARGLSCDPATSTCRAITYVGPGATCDAFNVCATGFCRFDGPSHTCPAITADGEPCDNGATCNDFAFCTAPPGNGFPDAGPGSAGGPDAAPPPPVDAGFVSRCTLFDPATCR